MKSNRPNLSRKQMCTAEFKRPTQSIISLEERKRQKESIKIYNIYDGGGDDAS